jgi:hypothetical protein
MRIGYLFNKKLQKKLVWNNMGSGMKRAKYMISVELVWEIQFNHRTIGIQFYGN